MNRRSFIAGVGSLAAASAAAVGTGAFTSASAERAVSVSVANEDEAYLALSPTQDENATFVGQDNSANKEISIDINDATGTQDDGDGVGLNSTYEFDDVFQVENQGTQDVDVSISELSGTDFDPDASGLTVQFYPGSNSGSPLHNSPVTVGTGNSQTIGLKVVTEEPSIDDFDADATVSADAI